MADQIPLVDATVFLGMHHDDDRTRRRSLAFFRGHLAGQVLMNFEQVGICDAIIWRRSRHVQDLYYPFMDRLHTDMQILREGYAIEELRLALRHEELARLRPHQALLAAQALHRDARLATHDPALRGLACMRPHLWEWGRSPRLEAFPPELEALYHASRSFVHGAGDPI